jgi:DNA-binding Xre family transcriptional regulator
MRWNLRMAAAQRDIWKASEMQRLLAEHGLVVSAGKMSALWSGQPPSIKLADLEVICTVLGCEVGDLLLAEPGKVSRTVPVEPGRRAAAGSGSGPTSRAAVVPRRRSGRSLPPA